MWFQNGDDSYGDQTINLVVTIPEPLSTPQHPQMVLSTSRPCIFLLIRSFIHKKCHSLGIQWFGHPRDSWRNSADLSWCWTAVHLERPWRAEGWAVEYNVKDAKSRRSGALSGGGLRLCVSEMRWAGMAYGSVEAYWWKGIDEASVCSMKPPAHYCNPRTAKQLDASPRHMSACHAPLTALCASYPTLQIRRKVNRIYRLLSVSPIASASRHALVTGALAVCVSVCLREKEINIVLHCKI